jgi:hypothetical protein
MSKMTCLFFCFEIVESVMRLFSYSFVSLHFGDQICDSHWSQTVLYLLGKHLKLFYLFSLHFGD